MTEVENYTREYWCAAFARRRGIPMTLAVRTGFDEVLLDLTRSAPTGTLRDCAREAVLGLGIAAPGLAVVEGGAA